jgi:hypothetical protein
MTTTHEERRARYVGRIEAFDAVIEKVRTLNGNGRDESDPFLEMVIDYATDLRSRARANLAAENVAAEDSRG